jgi:hypothetical protein
MYTYIKDNLNEVKDRIAQAAIRSGRQPEEITLIAVTKTLPVDVINAAMTFGVTDIGENKVQEVMDKYDSILNEPKWHLIGHLQSNKVKYIADKVSLIHSVDSLRLAEEISKRCEKIEKVMDVLIQINVAEEDTKFGIKREEIYELVEQVSALPNIRIKGLMAIAPNTDNDEALRKYFSEMKDIFETLKKTMYNRTDMTYLSMGMSNDYEIAIEEGANMVRIGTGIFGARNYNK